MARDRSRRAQRGTSMIDKVLGHVPWTAWMVGLGLLGVLGVASLLVGVLMLSSILGQQAVSVSGAIPEKSAIAMSAPGVLEGRTGPVEVVAEREGGGRVHVGVAREAEVQNLAQGLATATITGFEAKESVFTVDHVAAEKGVFPAQPEKLDLWRQVQTGEGKATLVIEPSAGRWLVAALGDTADKGPTKIVMTWTDPTPSPLALPLMIGGALMVLIAGGVVLASVRSATRRSDPADAQPVVDEGEAHQYFDMGEPMYPAEPGHQFDDGAQWHHVAGPSYAQHPGPDPVDDAWHVVPQPEPQGFDPWVIPTPAPTPPNVPPPTVVPGFDASIPPVPTQDPGTTWETRRLSAERPGRAVPHEQPSYQSGDSGEGNELFRPGANRAVPFTQEPPKPAGRAQARRARNEEPQ